MQEEPTPTLEDEGQAPPRAGLLPLLLWAGLLVSIGLVAWALDDLRRGAVALGTILAVGWTILNALAGLYLGLRGAAAGRGVKIGPLFVAACQLGLLYFLIRAH